MRQEEPLSEIYLSEVPIATSTYPQRRSCLCALFSVPAIFNVCEPVRFGANSQSPLAIPVLWPDGRVAATVRF